MKYFALLTTYGEKVLAEATALGTKVELTHMAVGDGGGTLPTPDTKQTKLLNEKRRAAINTLFIDEINANQVIAEQVIPENEGGWWIREIGLFDKSGLLVAVANCPETYKPLLAEGSGRTQTIRMVLIVSHTEAVTVKVDPSVVLATREFVNKTLEQHEKSRKHPDATTTEKGFVQLANKLGESNTLVVTQKLLTDELKKVTFETRTWQLTAAGGETELNPPYQFKSCLFTLNGLTQHDGYSYTIENNKVLLAEGLKKGEQVQIVIDAPLISTPQASGLPISKDARNALTTGSDNGIYLDEEKFQPIDDITVDIKS